MNIRISVLVALLAVQPAMALDFKGVTLGEWNSPGKLAALGVDEPTGATELEGLTVFSKVTIAADGTVQRIDVEFKPYQFDTIAAAATRKWGKPTTSGTLPMQNGFGAQFRDQVRTWERDGWTVSIFQYVDSDSGALSIAPHVNAADPSKSRM